VAVLGTPDSLAQPPLRPEGPQIGERPRGPVTATSVVRMLEYQDYRCALTGRRLTPDVAALDHVVPVRNGGKHVIENAQILHKIVNRAKSTMTNDEFIQMCREVVELAGSETSEMGRA
jgi:5-methylcytosine-specific restriction endonuclease McrA